MTLTSCPWGIFRSVLITSTSTLLNCEVTTEFIYTYSTHGVFSCGKQEESPRLWAYMVGTYWVSFVAYFLLWRGYKHASNLRASALMSPEVKNEQFAVVVRDIPPVPKGQTRKEQVDSYFRAIYPDTFYRSMVVTDNTKVL